MSQLSNWFASFKLGSLEKAAKGILKILVPILAPALKASADTLWDTAKGAVENAEQTGQGGDRKFELAYEAIKDGLGDASKVLFSVAIELAVAFLRARYKL